MDSQLVDRSMPYIFATSPVRQRPGLNKFDANRRPMPLFQITTRSVADWKVSELLDIVIFSFLSCHLSVIIYKVDPYQVKSIDDLKIGVRNFSYQDSTAFKLDRRPSSVFLLQVPSESMKRFYRYQIRYIEAAYLSLFTYVMQNSACLGNLEMSCA
jgi:hypothetical protein